ncbi:MAG: DNA polymerase III subunit delta' [Planctomycetota bacterium]
MSFHEILGHAGVIERLRAAIRNDRLAHAYLFDGPAGVGKRLVAVSLAKALHCEKEGPTDFCGTCASCRMVETDNHPNVWIYAPDAKKRDFTVDRVRALQGEMGLKAMGAGMRVYILEGAELMNDEAQNRMLKALEEPGEGTVLILVTTRPERLRPTVRSRVQRVRFGTLSKGDIRRKLTTERGLSEETAAAIAAMSGGSLGRALALAEGEEFATAEMWVRTFAELAQARDALEAAKALVATVGEKAAKRVEGKRRIAEYLGHVENFWHDVMTRQAGWEGPGLSGGHEEEAAELARRLDPGGVLRIIAAVAATREDLARGVQGRLAVLALAIRCRREIRRGKEEMSRVHPKGQADDGRERLS